MYEDVVPFRGQRLGLAGAALVAVGSVLAWTGSASSLVVAPSVEGVTSLSSPRSVVLLGAFVVWVVVLFRDWSWVEQLVVAAGGGLVVGLVGPRFLDRLGGGGEAVGVGLVLVVAGGVLLLVGGGLDYVTERGGRTV